MTEPKRPGVRSYRANEVSVDELHAAVADSAAPAVARAVRSALEDIAAYAGDAWVVDGDLRVPGDLDLAAAGVWLLVVGGDLVVEGCYGDSDDPETFAFVRGSLRARDIVTAGSLEVRGDVHVRRLIGDYNHGLMTVGGDVVADLVYGEEHFFAIAGQLRAGVVIGETHLEGAPQPAHLEMDDPALLAHFDRELLRVLDDVDEDDQPVVEVDGLADFAVVKRRVRAGQPLRADWFTGGCLCGEVRLLAVGRPYRVGICHCLDCRKHHGALFHASAIFPEAAVTVRGAPSAYAGRQFCARCGSSVFARTGDEVEVHLGALDAPDLLRPTYESWTCRREAWLPAFPVARRYQRDRDGSGRTED